MLIRLLRTYVLRYRGAVVAVVCLQLVATAAMLYLPTLNADIIDIGVANGDTGYILSTGGWMLLVSLAQIAGSVAAMYFGSRAALGGGRDIRHDLLHRVNGFSTREVGRFGAPSLITRTTNDVQQVQLLAVMAMSILVTAPIMGIGGIVMGVRVAAPISWVLVVAVPVLGITMGLIISRMIPGFRAMQTRIDNVNRIMREQVTGIRVVRAFVREQHETERFGSANDDLAEASLRVGRMMALMFPSVMLITNLTLVAVLWFGAHAVNDGSVEIGALTAMISYVMQIMMSVMMASFLAMMAPRAGVCADRICEVLDTETTVTAPAAPQPIVGDPAVLRLDDVEFRYPGADEPVLSGISFQTAPGTTTAVVGSTGSGKTTLINLLPRMLDVTGGSITIGGTDLRDADPDALRRHFGLVPQRPYLFSGTIASNLRNGKPDATEDEMWEALTIAQAADFVRAMPDGLDTPVAQGGTTVSGGQRQRLAIARALIRKPSIYLFDDSFSALDLTTDSRLREALVPATRDAALVVVAQRISTITAADQIVVLDRGTIVGLGTHTELLQSCPTYAEIAESQLSIGAGA
ncbi:MULTISPECIES: ABC transporter ATP-binding protein [Gordonia]|uniref:ABC transporter ATP-binding protein n=2 Tax=Gordonia TaxID=2053 RepID=A0ABN3H463_9ACTN|nr:MULTISPECIES: ABC transporter ATP-binding protein [Gordonia]AUH67612.1 ABC transporter ATP-binding protein [Gordonia sp. YC-JH1]MBY4568720.1 multidrug ABC transporter ATP-binding protein [Gordonia sihwensis]WFN92718.1 ABC transporter ATP-binding protein [Gordonia sihwensis]GAC61495.1 putative ABC transporter permease/ATP-binding protein [Gordonia sihwensis NBRC 108236]